MTGKSPGAPHGDEEAAEPRAEASTVLRAAVLRDDLATARDAAAESRDALAASRDAGSDGNDRLEGSADAAYARTRGRRDRQRSALDRDGARSDRLLAGIDRAGAARDRRSLLVDSLTGAHGREAGLMELERQVTQARRTFKPYLVAFVDVDGLKKVNDALGHFAGDRRLVDTVEAIRNHVRAYDVIVRHGGDEFVCGLAEMDSADAAQRFVDVNEQLAAGGSGQISVGLAALGDGETLDDLIARADAAMYACRNQRQPRAPRGAGSSE